MTASLEYQERMGYLVYRELMVLDFTLEGSISQTMEPQEALLPTAPEVEAVVVVDHWVGFHMIVYLDCPQTGMGPAQEAVAVVKEEKVPWVEPAEPVEVAHLPYILTIMVLEG